MISWLKFESNFLRRQVNARYVFIGVLALILLRLLFGQVPEETLTTLLSTGHHYLFNPQTDRAGNSTGLLMASALTCLAWFHNRRSATSVLMLFTLGISAGAGL